MASDEKQQRFTRDFSRVIITLENVLVPEEKLSPTPSMVDGLDSEIETDLRILGCELIQTSGMLLKLPQVAMATGQVLFQRFYYSKSFVKHNVELLAMACINLASKIEESPRRIRDIVNVFHHIRQVKNGKTITSLVLDQNYINLKNQVIKAERRILKELGFCVHVKHPHKIIVMYLQVLEAQTNQRLVQSAWNYMNDSFRTDVFVRHPPESIACACIFLAARSLQIPLPNSPPWYAVFHVEEYEIHDICLAILRLYSRSKPNVDDLERVVNEVKKIHIEAKLKAKGISSQNATPNSSSRPSSPAKISPSPLTIASMKKLKVDDDRSHHSSNDGSQYNHSSKKRGHSRSRSRSRSRSYSSHSPSRSPLSKRRYTPPRKSKKDVRRKDRHAYRDREYKENRDKYYRERDRDRDRDAYKDDYHKDYAYKEKDYRTSQKHRGSTSNTPEPAYSHSPEHSHATHKKYHKKDERYRSRSRSMDRDRQKSRSKHNGHHRSRSHERYRR